MAHTCSAAAERLVAAADAAVRQALVAAGRRRLTAVHPRRGLHRRGRLQARRMQWHKPQKAKQRRHG